MKRFFFEVQGFLISGDPAAGKVPATQPGANGLQDLNIAAPNFNDKANTISQA